MKTRKLSTFFVVAIFALLVLVVSSSAPSATAQMQPIPITGRLATFQTVPFATATKLVTGGEHTCAVMGSGGVECWGRNNIGQLGNNSTADSSIPVDVSGLTNGVIAIAAGWGHTCALTVGGGVKCWGLNDSGQLGNNSTINSSIPVDVWTLSSGVSAIVGGGEHTCALTTSGGVKCWGGNAYGQLGDGTTTPNPPFGKLIPVDVSGLPSGVSAIAAGYYHTCAVLMASGGAKCWGWNYHGQLGDSSVITRITPVDVSGLMSGVSAISGGGGPDMFYLYRSHTCALTASGGVKCWGSNFFGQLGDSTTVDRHTFVNVSGLTSPVSGIALGGIHTCALTTGGGVDCWGANIKGQLGNNSNTDSNTPVHVTGLTGEVSAIAAGGDHTCAVMTSGGIKCWGSNGYGQLGNQSTTDSNTPVPVVGLPPLGVNTIKLPFKPGSGTIGRGYGERPTHTGSDTYAFDIYPDSECRVNGLVLAPANMRLVYSGPGSDPDVPRTSTDYHIFEIYDDLANKTCLDLGHFIITLPGLTKGQTVQQGAKIGRLMDYPTGVHYHIGAFTIPSNTPAGCGNLSPRTPREFVDAFQLDGIAYKSGQSYHGQSVTSTNVPICTNPFPASDCIRELTDPIPGDLNADGLVDNSDFNLLQTYFGQSGIPGFVSADIDKNGKVDLSDFSVLYANFGMKVLTSGSGGAARSTTSSTLNVPNPPTNLSATSNFNSIGRRSIVRVSWVDNSDNEDGFVLTWGVAGYASATFQTPPNMKSTVLAVVPCGFDPGSFSTVTASLYAFDAAGSSGAATLSASIPLPTCPDNYLYLPAILKDSKP